MRYGPKRRALQCLLLGIENLTGTQGGTQRMRPGWMPFLGLTCPPWSLAVTRVHSAGPHHSGLFWGTTSHLPAQPPPSVIPPGAFTSIQHLPSRLPGPAQGPSQASWPRPMPLTYPLGGGLR